MIYVLILLLLPLSLGYLTVLFLTQNKPLPKIFALALGYGVGTGSLSQLMLVLGMLNIPLTPLSINTPMITIILILFFILKSKNVQMISFHPQKWMSYKNWDIPSFLMFLYISFYVLYIFWRAFNIPIFTWDAFSTHAFHGKIFFTEQSIKFHPYMPHHTYPLHTPFMQAWIALNLGSWNDQLVKAFYPFYFLSYLVIQYVFLNNYTIKRWALLSVVFLVSSNFLTYHATKAYRDFTMLYFNCTCVILLFTWIRTKDKNILLLTSLMAGFMTFNKLEGIGYFLIYLLVISILVVIDHSSIRNKLRHLAIFTIPCTMIFGFYQLYQKFIVTPKSAPTPINNLNLTLETFRLQFTIADFKKLWIIGENIGNNLFYSNNWSMIWVILIISLANVRNTHPKKEVKLMLAFLMLFFGLFYCGYTFTQHYFWATQTNTVISRGILHIYPLATIVITLIHFSQNPQSILKNKYE